MSGKFIILEGLNGCGKTTQAHHLCRKLPASYFHELGSHSTSSFPNLLKRLLHMDDLSEVTEQYFITGSRSRNLQYVQHMLDLGANVVYDRYVYSSHIYSHREVQYQPETTDAVWDLHNTIKVWDLHDTIKNNPVPTVTIILDIDPDEQKRRLRYRKDLDKYEKVSDQVIEYRRNVYLAMGRAKSNNYVVNGMLPEESVYHQIREILKMYKI